jgi:hypothetical protein
VRLKTLAVSGIFWILFLLLKKSSWLERIQVKTIMRTPRGMMARSVLLIFNTTLNHALTLTVIPRGVRLAFFKRNPFRPTYFLPTAA